MPRLEARHVAHAPLLVFTLELLEFNTILRVL